MQFAERICHQTELIHGRLDFLHVTARQGRPQLGSRSNAFARLRQQSWIKTPKARLLIVHRMMALQAKCRIHRSPHRCRLRVFRHRRSLCTEKQHVLQQALWRNRIAFGQSRRHHEHSRCHAFGVNVCLQQSISHCVEIGCSNLPENAHGWLGLRLCKPHAHITHARAGRCDILPFDDLQHGCIQHFALLWAVAQRRYRLWQLRISEPALNRPQVCRVYLAFVAIQRLHVTVLRKQRHR